MLKLLLALREMAVPLIYEQALLVVPLVQVHAIRMLLVGSPVLGLTSGSKQVDIIAKEVFA